MRSSQWHHFVLTNVIPAMSPEELMAFAISNDPDTLTYRHREAMAAPDKEQFIQSMVKEVQGQLDLKMLHHVPRSKAPPTASVLPAVWTFCPKRRQTTGKILKFKGRLNIGGHRMREDINHDLTYSPTASWPAVCLALGMILPHGRHAKQVNYVQAYPQAPAT